MSTLARRCYWAFVKEKQVMNGLMIWRPLLLLVLASMLALAQGNTALAEPVANVSTANCQAVGNDEQGRRVSCQLAADTVSGEVLLRSLNELQRAGSGRIDWKDGLALLGQGDGGLAAIERSVDMPGESWRALVTSVEAQDVSGDVNTVMDVFTRAAQSGAAQNIHYRLAGRNLEPFFHACEQWLVACTGVWSATGKVTLKPEVPVRLNQVLPIFTAASTNRWAANGHYNQGLQYQARGITRSAARIVVPVRYLAGDQQAPGASFNLTLRRLGEFTRHAGREVSWTLSGTAQKGTVLVSEAGSLTLEGLTLDSSTRYSKLLLQGPEPLWQLVYTRQPRARKPVPGTPIKEAANWQHASDVARINIGLAEADVVIDDLDGQIKVIHNCTESQEVCVAHEARVSPDGTKIAYSVGYGEQLVDVYTYDAGLRLNIQEIPQLTHAQLWIYDLQTGLSKPIPAYPGRAIDRQPEWLNNKRIVFASNRANTYPPKNQFSMHRGKDQFGKNRCFNPDYCVSQIYGYGHAGKSMQIWSMNIDGTDARNLTPHEGNALSPTVMSNGDVLYSCWNAQENKTFDNPLRTANNPGTTQNKWWLCRMDGNGGDSTVILNGHKTTILKTKEWLSNSVTGGEGRTELRAIRGVAEIFKDRLAVSNYYRSNHVGSMGIIFAMDYNDPHVEGCSTAACQPHGLSNSRKPGSGNYVPSSLLAITPYGTDQDMAVLRDGKGRAMGKAGYAAPLPDTDSEFLITHGRGSCYEVTPPEQASRRAMGGEPTCQKAIYKVKVPMVTDPFDERQMEFMAGGDQWQAFDARAVASFQRLHGQPLPKQLPPLDPELNCYLQVVDARAAELNPSADRYDWTTNLYAQCGLQGCAVNTEDRTFHERNMAALTVYLPQMWDFSWDNSRGKEQEFVANVNNMGHKSIALLGSQPVLPDGSVKMQVPCETPLLMAGTDAQGMSIAHDSMLHSLRAGETRTCHGCHDGHSEERAARIKGSAIERFSTTQAFNTYPELPKAIAPIDFDDVRPILERRCSSCHKDMQDDDGLLYSRIAQDYEQYDWPWARKQRGVLSPEEYSWVVHVLIKKSGSGYKVGETLRFPSGVAKGVVSKVSSSGGVAEISLTSAGNNYGPMTPVQVNTADGKGANLQAITSVYALQRPYTSKWVAKFARDSLLYWKCVGARRDGRTDKQYRNDIDFGPAHPTEATAQECRTIGQWIDTGVQR
ncbi:MAG: hypothetical protein ACI9NT_001128 [Bacteroidia bacterium]|jgi:hypothetical protein